MDIILYVLIGILVLALIVAIINSSVKKNKKRGAESPPIDKDKILEELSIKIDILTSDSPYVSDNRINFSSSDELERRMKKASLGHIPLSPQADPAAQLEIFDALTLKAEKLFIDEDFIHALIQYREAEKFLPKDPLIRKQTWLYMGSIYYNLGVFDRALEYLSKADMDNSYDYDLLLLLLTSSLKLGLWKHANLFLTRLILAGNDNYQIKQVQRILKNLLK